MQIDQAAEDDNHLRSLAMFHHAMAVIVAIFSCFPLAHLVVGGMLAFAPHTFSNHQNVPVLARLIGVFFMLFAGAFVLSGWTLAVCLWIAAQRLLERRHYRFCFGIAVAIIFMTAPLGALLGAFTIIVLMRPSVKQEFEEMQAVEARAASANSQQIGPIKW